MQIHPLFQKALCIAAIVLLAPAVWARDCFVYFGTFTDTSSKGIYVSRLNMDTGKLSPPQLAVAASNPNFLAVSPDGHFLYAALRADNTTNEGLVGSFAIDPRTGALKELDEKPAGGSGTCAVGTDPAGLNLFAANYNSGNVKSFHINRTIPWPKARSYNITAAAKIPAANRDRTPIISSARREKNWPKLPVTWARNLPWPVIWASTR